MSRSRTVKDADAVGAQIPLGARIICACGAWQAMTSDRAYRRALDPAHALSELREQAGTRFDPDVVDALLAVLAEAPGRTGVAG